MIVINIAILAGIQKPDRLFLRGQEMSELDTLTDAWLEVCNGRITGFGRMADLDMSAIASDTVDAAGGIVMPAFCDSHTHIVYAGSREQEFIDKINGLSYEEIARRGGGILNSADRLAQTPENELYRQSKERLDEVVAMGTGCIEIKSGYGLSTQSELKMLRVTARLAESTPATVKSTFLGAHAVGRAYTGRQSEYVDMLCNEMLPAVNAEGLAEFVDVFCDRGFFTVEETDRILETAAKFGMRPKIHANELDISGGVQVGIRHDALSVDHLERISEDEIRLLATHGTVATMLPGASFFLGMPYAPARKAIDAGAIVALASDYNPGSSPSGNMRMVMSLGCIKMKLSPAEALNATTVNGAYAMGLSDRHGSITVGKKADFLITRPVPSLDFIPYAYTTPFIKAVYLGGNKIA